MPVEAGVGRSGAHFFPAVGAAERVRLVSRACVPAELGLARDPRELGVAVRSLVVRQCN